MGAYSREKRLQLAKERGILVDPEDEWLLEEYTWHLFTGYATTNVPTEHGYRRAFLHHCIVGQPIWEGEEIDHKNRVRSDDRRQNLRYVTKSRQAMNTDRAPGASGARNVYIDRGRYQVTIWRDGYEYYLGRFGTLDEAVATRDEWLYHHKEYVS